MRLFGRSILVAGLLLSCAACASQQVGTVAGDVVGGTAWVAVKGGKALFNGGKFAVKTTGRTVKGAATGIHEEFDKPAAPKTAQAKADPQKVASLSE